MTTAAVEDMQVEILAGNYFRANITFIPYSGSCSIGNITATLVDADYSLLGTYTNVTTPAVTTTGANAFQLIAQIPRTSKSGKVALDTAYTLEWADGVKFIYKSCLFDVAASRVPT